MTGCNIYSLVCHSNLSRKASYCGRYELSQRETAGKYVLIERHWCWELQVVMALPEATENIQQITINIHKVNPLGEWLSVWENLLNQDLWEHCQWITVCVCL